ARCHHRTAQSPADADEEAHHPGEDQGVDGLQQRQSAELPDPIERELAEPVDVLKVLAVDGVGEAVFIEELPLLRHDAPAGEVVPEVGLVVPVDAASDEDESGSEERADGGIREEQRETRSTDWSL